MPTMLATITSLALSLTFRQVAASTYSVHNITRFADFKFENLAVRANGQILTTTAGPTPSIYQVDPLGILPPTLIYTIPNVTSATGISEGKPDFFYVASSDVNLTAPLSGDPSSFFITELDLRGVNVLPNGELSRQPGIRRAASLPAAKLLNGVAFARPESDHLLVTDSFRGLIWNVNVCSGNVSIVLEDNSTKGSAPSGMAFTGVNGIKVYDGTAYYTSTGANTLYKVAIDDLGNVRAGAKPILVASNISCDDLELDCRGNAYVAGPQDILTKVSPDGRQEIIAGSLHSNSSTLIGPTSVKFGRLASDHWSIYITTNGGMGQNISGSEGISRIDLATENSAPC